MPEIAFFSLLTIPLRGGRFQADNQRTMAFFQFGRKLDLAKEYSLAEIPLFSTLTPAEQKQIEKRARLVQFKRGDLVYEEGTEPDAFYVVISGRFHLFTRGRGDAGDETLLFFYRGDHFGETSLLLGHAHSASVEAKSDGLILKLLKDDFLKMVQEIPGISLNLTRTLGHRLTKREDASGRRREVKIAGLFSELSANAAFHLWGDLANRLGEISGRKVILVEIIPETHPAFKEKFGRPPTSPFDLSAMNPTSEEDVRSGITGINETLSHLHVKLTEEGEAEEKKIAALLTHLTYRYDFVLVRLPRDFTSIAFQSLKQTDVVYIQTEADASSLVSARSKIDEFQQGYGFSRNDIKVLLSDNGQETASAFLDKEATLGHRIFHMLPDRAVEQDRYDQALRFIVKEFAGTLLGVALGSGAAFGLAHIGVLQVMEEENIPVDIISGSSMGAFVGALWAAGYSGREMGEIACGIDKKTGFFKLLGFGDISIAHWGFFRGQQVMRFMESYIGKKTFQELRLPLKIAATNLHTSEEIIFRAGSVVDAVRASISIPGIFRPFRYRGDALIDGGVIDPLPVRVLSNLGVKKIIGVNVLPAPRNWADWHLMEQEKRQKALSDSSHNLMQRITTRLKMKMSQHYSNNVFNVIMNTIQFMEYQVAHAGGAEADIVIEPISEKGHWAEFYSARKFIDVGIEKTREVIPEIKRLLKE